MKSAISLTLAALMGLGALTSCGNGDSAKSGGYQLSDISNPTTGDSLMFYLGQMQSGEYWRMARRDSTYASEEARKEFMRGLRAGMDAVRESDAYNMGVFQGIQIAMNLKDFPEEYEGVAVNREVMLRAMTAGLDSDSAVNFTEAQQMFQMMMTQLDKAKEERDRAASIVSLASTAKDLKMERISDTLYGRTIEAGNGKRLTAGNKVDAEIKITEASGKEVPVPMPRQIEIGSRYVTPVIAEALATMDENGSAAFVTSAYMMFGNRCERMGLKPDQILTIAIKLGSQSASAKPADTTAPVINPSK